MQKTSYAKIAEGVKPSFVEVLTGMSREARSGRIYYHDWQSTPVVSRQDPVYTDYGANIIGIHGDGNCLFRALAYAVGDPSLDHVALRQKICEEERKDELLREVFPDLDGYINSMRKGGEFGGEPEIRAAARVLHRLIYVWENGHQVAAHGAPNQSPIHLCYYSRGQHYDLHMVAPSPPTPPTPQEEQTAQTSPAITEQSTDNDGAWTIVKGRGGRQAKCLDHHHHHHIYLHHTHNVR